MGLGKQWWSYEPHCFNGRPPGFPFLSINSRTPQKSSPPQVARVPAMVSVEASLFPPFRWRTVAFCSMGHSIFSVSVVQFLRGKLRVLSERSDKVGGRDMDERLGQEVSSRQRGFAEVVSLRLPPLTGSQTQTQSKNLTVEPY